jgi:TRAP transporter 4TM/12TM fusion protein
MAETLGVPYLEIVKAAIIPALLYFASAFWMVHLEAGRSMMKGIPKADCPNPWQAMRQRWYLLIPLLILVTLLFSGYTPMFSGLAGLAMTAILILGVSLSREATKKAIRYGIWIIIGLAASAFRKFGIGPIVGLIGALVAFNLLSVGGRTTLRLMGNSLIDGAKQALGVGMACAIVGVIIGVVTLTGVASNFTSVIVELGTTSIFLSLILTMVACLILGMGIPTIPNYIITSSIAAPALLMLGVPLIVSHMFVFYFGIMADLTPPVALAAFAAASIAKTSGLKIGVQAMRVAFAGFIIPFMAVYDPVLMLQGTYTLWDLVYILAKVLAAIGLWGVASIGYLNRPVTWPERGLAALGALFLAAAIPWTDAVGFALGAFFLVVHLRLYRKLRPGTAS